MSRSVPWRRSCPDAVSRRVEQALDARFYLLRETGPTGFLVKQDEDDKKYKVRLGDPNSCTCPNFMKERDQCIHILWVLLRKFRIAKENSLLFQQALVEREINEIIQGIHVQRRSEAKTVEVQLEEKGKLPAKSIDDEDVCPICQEELFNCKEPLTHCKYGCGNNIHIKCMKVWAQHRKSNGDNLVKCPLCRSDFGTYQEIIQEFHRLSSRQRKKIETNDIHIGATCQNCRSSPIQGKCFRCVVCLDFHLCEDCFGKQVHTQHSFQFRKNTNQRWRPASRNPTKNLPDGIADNLQRRELSEDDYELLLNLDRASNDDSIGNGTSIVIPLYVLRSNSVEIKDNLQCQICCKAFEISNCVRRLACKHSFHHGCIDDWVSRGNSLCPFDGQRIAAREEVIPRKSRETRRSNGTADNSDINLSIMGINSLIGQANKHGGNVTSEQSRRRSRHLSSRRDEDVCDINQLMINGLSGRPDDVEARSQTTSSLQMNEEANRYPTAHLPANRRTSKSSMGLPPIHPKKTKLRGSSVTSRNYGNEKQSHEELSLGFSAAVDSSLNSNAMQRRSRSNPIKKRLSTGILASSSTSEPDLIALTDAFRISGISRTGNSKSSDSQ